MAWNGITCTKLSPDKPALPRSNGDFPPDGWTVGYLVLVPGQDDGTTI